MTSEEKVAELLYGSFIDILRNAGAAPNVQQMEVLRNKCNILGTNLTKVVRKEALDCTRDLQAAVQKGFEKADEKFADVYEKLQ